MGLSEEERQQLQRRLAAVARCPRPAVASLAATLSDRYEAAFHEVGITTAQFTLLSAIGFAGEIPVTELTRYVARDQTTLSRGVQRLQQRGWVETSPLPEDRRVHLVRITDAGGEVLSRAMDAWEAVRDELERVLGTEALDELIDTAWRATKALRSG